MIVSETLCQASARFITTNGQAARPMRSNIAATYLARRAHVARMNCSAIRGTNIPRRIVNVPCMLYAVCCMLYTVCRMLYAVCCKLHAVLSRGRPYCAVNLCDGLCPRFSSHRRPYCVMGLCDGHCPRFGVLPQRGSTHRRCKPDLQPHCGPVL
jgi:hypothetical protein